MILADGDKWNGTVFSTSTKNYVWRVRSRELWDGDFMNMDPPLRHLYRGVGYSGGTGSKESIFSP